MNAISLAALSGALLALSLLWPPAFALAWVGLIPLLWVTEGQNIRRTWYLGVITGTVLYALTTHWMVAFFINSQDYSFGFALFMSLGFWLYSAQIFGLTLVIYRFIKKRIPLYPPFIFAVLIGFFYAYFPNLFTLHLGQSQSSWLVALQGTEWTGVYGLNFIIALANAMIYHWLRGRGFFATTRPSHSVLGGVLMLGLWLGYGGVASLVWASKTDDASKHLVGVVQTNQSEFSNNTNFTRVYPPALSLTEGLLSEGAELIVWPEQAAAGYFQSAAVKRSFQNAVNRAQTPLLLQDVEALQQIGGSQLYNAAFLLEPESEPGEIYYKSRRLSLDGFIPLSEDSNALKSWIKQLRDIWQQDERIARATVNYTKHWAVSPLLGDDAMSSEWVARTMAMNFKKNIVPGDNTRLGQLLVLQGDHRWFEMSFIHNIYSQLTLNSAILRAVENRTPTVLAINQGPSALINPNGSLRFQSEPGIAAGYLVEVPKLHLAEATFFTRHPNAFRYLMALSLVLLIGYCGTKSAVRMLRQTSDSYSSLKS